MEISCSPLAQGDKINKRVEWFYVQSRLFCELLVCWPCNSESESDSESDSELSKEEGEFVNAYMELKWNMSLNELIWSIKRKNILTLPELC